MIELIDILKTYGSRMVLNVSYLSFEEEKRYALIGVNGCGKTTLLRIMAGIIKPDKGWVKNVPMERTGYMPQSPYAFGFSVQKNVEIGLKKANEAETLSKKALQAVGIETLSRARGNKLSGGETQRMAFARMIAMPRTLLLLDEPTSSADIRGMDKIEKTLLDYFRDTGCTIIFSTHSPAQALRLAEVVIFLDQGFIIEAGDASSILRNPKKPSTRLFLQHWKL